MESYQSYRNVKSSADLSGREELKDLVIRKLKARYGDDYPVLNDFSPQNWEELDLEKIGFDSLDIVELEMTLENDLGIYFAPNEQRALNGLSLGKFIDKAYEKIKAQKRN